MSVTIDCPHTQPAVRQSSCPGCTQPSSEDILTYCDGEVTGTFAELIDGFLFLVRGEVATARQFEVFDGQEVTDTVYHARVAI